MVCTLQRYEIKPGQWIKISGYEEGQVEDVTCMITRIRTRNGSLLNIPNSTVLQATVQNYGYPDDMFWMWINLEAVPEAEPEYVTQILKSAMLSCDSVLKEPRPVIEFEGQGDSSAKYKIYVAVRDYGKKKIHRTSVWRSAWAYLDKAGIDYATPHRILSISTESRAGEVLNRMDRESPVAEGSLPRSKGPRPVPGA